MHSLDKGCTIYEFPRHIIRSRHSQIHTVLKCWYSLTHSLTHILTSSSGIYMFVTYRAYVQCGTQRQTYVLHCPDTHTPIENYTLTLTEGLRIGWDFSMVMHSQKLQSISLCVCKWICMMWSVVSLCRALQMCKCICGIILFCMHCNIASNTNCNINLIPIIIPDMNHYNSI